MAAYDMFRDNAKHDADMEWEGEGYYRIRWSDGGMDWTSNGPVRFGSVEDLADELASALLEETDTHLAWAEKVEQFQQYELEVLLGEFVDDYDVDGIIEDATALCGDGNRYWTVDEDELNEVLEENLKK